MARMIDFLKWVLTDFWHFIGFVIILGVCLQGLIELVQAIRRTR